jgi:hypothetical protein
MRFPALLFPKEITDAGSRITQNSAAIWPLLPFQTSTIPGPTAEWDGFFKVLQSIQLFMLRLACSLNSPFVLRVSPDPAALKMTARLKPLSFLRLAKIG